ncbi:hypothetical protein Acr_13g0001570 [Actinidia rufa]|uniref:Uncharacterized protein n=1 Tax=Actinidia rufa TaxID=165716 RepID=A0A7J0FJY9_9ERIC|nr:hypothetical protein Acr_13g0001570 [Actinidia rufa]
MGYLSIFSFLLGYIIGVLLTSVGFGYFFLIRRRVQPKEPSIICVRCLLAQVDRPLSVTPDCTASPTTACDSDFFVDEEQAYCPSMHYQADDEREPYGSRKLGEQPTVNIARIPWYWTSEAIKGRPAQTNRNKGPGRGRSKPLRRGDQTKAMTVGKIALRRIVECVERTFERWRESRKGQFPCIERILVEIEILSALPRPRARRRQYFGSGRSDEYSEGGSGELSGDSLVRSHADRWTRFTSVKRVRR